MTGIDKSEDTVKIVQSILVDLSKTDNIIQVKYSSGITVALQPSAGSHLTSERARSSPFSAPMAPRQDDHRRDTRAAQDADTRLCEYIGKRGS